MRLRSKWEEREALQLYITGQLCEQVGETLPTRPITTANTESTIMRAKWARKDSKNRGWRQGVPMTMAGPGNKQQGTLKLIDHHRQRPRQGGASTERCTSGLSAYRYGRVLYRERSPLITCGLLRTTTYYRINYWRRM